MSTDQTVLPIYVGYDQREHVAYEVCKHSLERTSSRPVFVQPIIQDKLRHMGLYRRGFHQRGGVNYDDIDGKPFSTEFSFTRFLVPALTQYSGWALFCDCDMLFRENIQKLFALRDDKYACMVVKHVHEPDEGIKMDDQVQQRYHRKNWSSFVLWNCSHPANFTLTPEAVNTETGGWLHAFGWLKDDEIGGLPETWNWLEGWSKPPIEGLGPANVHYTRGGPWFDDYRNVAYAKEWIAERQMLEREACTNQLDLGLKK